MTTPSRRTQQRYDVRIPVEFSYEGQDYQGQTRNMSIGGLFIETVAPLTFNAMVTVRFSIPTNKEPIEIEGQVRWIEQQGGAIDGVGIQFQALRAIHVWALNKFFQDKPPSK